MNRTFSTAEVCEMLDISKSTLFRWENDGILENVGRDHKHERVYTEDHIKRILARKFEHVAEMDTTASLESMHEFVSLRKFQSGDVTGLYELEEYDKLSSEAIQSLIHFLADYEFSDPIFGRLLRLISNQIPAENEALISMR